MKTKVVVFPKDKNPYQDLLYSRMKNDVRLNFLYTSPPTVPEKILLVPMLLLKLLVLRILGYRIIHIHWLYPFSLPNWVPFSYLIAFVNTIVFLVYLKILRYKLVWTVHNVLPHSQITINDLLIRKLISKISEQIIVHSKTAIEEMKILNIDVSKVNIVPIGSYKEAYPQVTSKSLARKHLNLSSKEFIILFFGAVRPDKNVTMLTEVFCQLSLTNSRLIIAGKSKDSSITKKISDMKLNSNIDFHNKYVPENEIADLIKSCDVFCVPFTEVTTSSSVILAMSMGRAVITPNIGFNKSLPADTGFYYEANDDNGLSDAIKDAYIDRATLKSKSKKALKYTSKLDWATISKKTFGIYRSLEKQNDI